MVLSSDIEWFYSQGPASIGTDNRPADGAGNFTEKGRFSLGGPPRTLARSDNEIPAYDTLNPTVNLQALFDDTLEADNEGSAPFGTHVDYRCIYVRNNSQQAMELNSKLFRARMWIPVNSVTPTWDAATAFAAYVLPVAANAGAPTAGSSAEADTIATKDVVPKLQHTGSADTVIADGSWKAIPSSAALDANTIYLNPASGADQYHLVKDRVVGIWIRRTVTEVAVPVGRIEEVPFTIYGGSPSSL